MGGVASVTVAPEERGRGVGGLLVGGLVEAMGELPLSVLFPATAPIYRAAGYEHAGSRRWVKLSPEALRTLNRTEEAREVKVRRAGPNDAGELSAIIRRVHGEALDSGPIDWGHESHRRTLVDETRMTYLADDGYLHMRWGDSGTAEVAVEQAIAASEATARALWSVVGSASSIAQTVWACLAPWDPMLWLLRDRSREESRGWTWMLRLLDAPAAMAARGFPAGLSAAVSLEVTGDRQRPGNNGSWLLSVADGRGELTPVADGGDPARLGPRGLAALYGGVPPATLRRAGLLAGGSPETDGVLYTAFAADAYMLNDF
jgi:predicted acetyltransferase